MKKISHNKPFFLLLLAALSFFPQTLLAQEQTPEIVLSVDYVEQDQEIPVSPDGGTATLHIISYGGIPEETLLSNIWSSLEALSITWITNVYLTNKEGIYEADLNFDISSNFTDRARELIVSASNGSSTITQEIHTPNVYTLLPNVNPVYLLHGGKNALILSSSDGFASYRLLKDTANNVTLTVAEVNGKSEGNRQLKFIINSPGSYRCIVYYPTQVQMNGTRTVEWHPFYDTSRSCSLSPNPYTFPKDGGSVSFTYNVTSSQDSILQRIVNFYNSGNCSVWDTTMVISYTRLSSSQVRMAVEAGPNLKRSQVYPPLPNTITNNTYFKNSAGDEISFTQAADGEIKAYSVSFPGDLGSVPPYLILDSTQHRVRYALFKDGMQYGPSRMGHGDTLHLTIPADSGKFTVIATYGGITKTMNGTLTVTGNMKAVWGDNWILKQTFTAEQGSASFMDITYYDGLGYPAQVINVGASPSGKNIITPVWHDVMRREDAKTYLPYASSTSSAPQPEADPFTSQEAFYANLYGNSDANFAYAEKVYENSPLNRVMSQFSPGEAYRASGTLSGGNDHHTAFSYEANAANEVLDMVCNEGGELSVRGYVAAAKLYKSTVTSPDGRTTTEFKDSDGTLFLQRSGTGNSLQETYYAYDSRRRLRWVLQPEGTVRIRSLAANSSSANPYSINRTDSTAINFCFLYNYDGRGRLIEKKIPGKGTEHMVYDPAGRLVGIQDSVQRQAGRWLLTRHDSLSRVAETYLFFGTSGTGSREQLQSRFNQSPYPENIYSASGNILLTCARYGTAPPAALNFANVTGVVTTHDRDTRTKGLLTYDRTLDLSTLSQPEAQRRYRERAYFYDSKGRVIQTVEKMPDGEVARNSVKYDFTGNPLATAYAVTKGSNASLQSGTQTLWQTFTYDHRGRKLAATAALNTTVYTYSAANYGYDPLGRLSESRRGKTSTKGSTVLSPSTATPVLQDSLSYNIQGWMASQTDKVLKGASSGQAYGLYSQILRYHDPQKANTPQSFDGLITEWETFQSSDGTDLTKPGTTLSASTYAFTYDSFGRLTESVRYSGSETTPTNTYTEQGLTFDRNGNILSLTRYGESSTNPQDNFRYSYSGNRIRHLAGRHDSGEITHLAEGGTVSGTAEYVYDGNGNMTLDALRNISITYDINNLVRTVSRNDTILSNYTYLADGTKYKVMQGTESLGSSNSRSGRVYLGPMTYRFEPAGTVPSVTSDMFYLENVDSECGRVVVFRRKTANGQNVTSSFTTLFSVNDHLGSTRVVMDAAGNILERNAYYPFGLQTDQGNDFPNMNSTLPALYPRYINPSATRRDLYNGKEIQSIAGTDYLDYGFRQYDPVTARWMAVDPKAEKYLSMTLYGYCAENPINFIDNIGLKIDDYYDYVTGRYLGTDGASTNNMRIIRDDIFHNIVSNHGGTSKTEEATSELQENSKIITVEREKINNDIITIVDKSYETRIENALYLLLDRENAILTSELSHNRGNTNNRSHINGNWASSTKILLHEKGNNLIVIAQIHGHPKSTSDLITLSGASDFDASGAQKNLIPVYAVDAMKKRKGKQVPIHRANPDGTIDNNIGYTIGMGPFNAFDIARDAMNRR